MQRIEANMSILLFGAGALAFVVGIAMVGYGVPINEFSFGNTLIISGTVAMVGGLIVVGLGAAVLYLRRVLDAVANQAPAEAGRSFTAFEQPAAAPPEAAVPRVPFPKKSKSEGKSNARSEARYELEHNTREPAGFEPMPQPSSGRTSDMTFNDQGLDYYAPSLPNPNESPLAVDDEVSLSPRQPLPAPSEFGEPRLSAPPGLSFSIDQADLDELRDQRPKRENSRRASPPPSPPRAAPTVRSTPADHAPPPERPSQTDWMPPAERQLPPERAAQPAGSPARPPPNGYFDSKWPAEPAAGAPPPAEPSQEPAFSRFPDEDKPADEPRSVAILKSGVVDGMGYTLYVDGSIEAELPQGTLRFASITDLRQHLEKTS
jgi:hypothetical protein